MTESVSQRRPFIQGGAFCSPATIIQRRAYEHPDRLAVRSDSCDLTYRQLWDAVADTAVGLREAGIRPHERVLLMLPMVPEAVVGYWALLSLGATVVSIDPQSPYSDLEYFAAISEASHALCESIDGERHEALERGAPGITLLPVEEADPTGLRRWSRATTAQAPSKFHPVDIEPSDPAVVTFTSGTTSRPKGVLHAYGSLLSQHEVVQRDWKLDGDQVVLNPLPFYTIFGLLTNSAAAVFSGATLALLGHFRPERFLDAIQRYGVTAVATVPTMYIMATNFADRDTYDLSSMRVAYTSGAAMTDTDMQRFTAWSGINLLAAYGMSECAVAAFEPPDRPHRHNSAGKFGDGFEWRVVDDEGRDLPPGEIGEVVMRGPTVMSEYIGMPEATAERLRDGWVFSADIGRVDEDGYIYLAGRRADIIIRGGLNIAPVEIETVLADHPGVHMAVVVGVDDEVFGQRVKACVLPAPGWREEQLRQELLELCTRRLPQQKVPEYLEFYDDLPRNANGKVLRNKLETIPR